MKMRTLEISNSDACFLADLLGEIAFSSKRVRNKPGFVKVSAITAWNISRIMEVQRIFDHLVNEE